MYYSENQIKEMIKSAVQSTLEDYDWQDAIDTFVSEWFSHSFDGAAALESAATCTVESAVESWVEDNAGGC